MNEILLNSMDYNQKQLREIQMGLQEGLDVSWYINPSFSHMQMSEIRLGLMTGVDVSLYADSSFSFEEMLNSRIKLTKEMEKEVIHRVYLWRAT